MIGPYCIELPKLKIGKHEVVFQVDASILATISEPLFENIEVSAKLLLEKTTMAINVHYHLTGRVQLACDRCLEQYWQVIDSEHRVIFSHDPSLREVEDDQVVFLSRDSWLLDCRQDLYDFIALQIPFRKIPADCPGSRCATDFIGLYLKSETDETENEAPADPRWEKLRGIDFLSN